MADPLMVLIQQFAKLPGVGEKTATRLAFHVLSAPDSFAQDLSQSISQSRTFLRLVGVVIITKRKTQPWRDSPSYQLH